MSGREHPEQIPTEDNKEETLNVISHQNSIPGEKREKTVVDLTKAAALGQILKDLDFPAEKKQIVEFFEQALKASEFVKEPQRAEMLSIVKSLDEKQYQNVSDVTEAARLVSE